MIILFVLPAFVAVIALIPFVFMAFAVEISNVF